eukprot:TRINITY_DN13122_c0_g1_i1.p1 TRINITY_DN13122_c0_g1~~TRINITY_DN13122_c0_g1_i1.p1  ORF type:complete len:366 (+),score=34.18 TRINITY_DN13122_c0_g1_i1:71-1099(+)
MVRGGPLRWSGAPPVASRSPSPVSDAKIADAGCQTRWRSPQATVRHKRLSRSQSPAASARSGQSTGTPSSAASCTSSSSSSRLTSKSSAGSGSGSAARLPQWSFAPAPEGSRPSALRGGRSGAPLAGYSGHVPGLASENVHGVNFKAAHRIATTCGGYGGDDQDLGRRPLSPKRGHYAGHVPCKDEWRICGLPRRAVHELAAAASSGSAADVPDTARHRSLWRSNSSRSLAASGSPVAAALADAPPAHQDCGVPGYSGHVPGALNAKAPWAPRPSRDVMSPRRSSSPSESAARLGISGYCGHVPRLQGVCGETHSRAAQKAAEEFERSRLRSGSPRPSRRRR